MAAGVSERTARKWRDRHQAEGAAGLVDHSSAPKSVPSRTPEDRIEAIAALRRLRLTGAGLTKDDHVASSMASSAASSPTAARERCGARPRTYRQ